MKRLRSIIRDIPHFFLSLSSGWRPINKFTESFDFGENRIGSGGPREGPIIGIVVGDKAADLDDQFADVTERSGVKALPSILPSAIKRPAPVHGKGTILGTAGHKIGHSEGLNVLEFARRRNPVRCPCLLGRAFAATDPRRTHHPLAERPAVDAQGSDARG